MKRLPPLLFLLVVSLLATGCWDMIDIEKQAFVLGMGIDTLQTPEGNVPFFTAPSHIFPEKKIHLTLEVFSPFISSRSPNRNTLVIHQDGPNEAGALRMAQAQIFRKINLTHLRAVVIGADYARKGIRDLIYYLDSAPQIADRFRMVICHEKRAEELLTAPLVTERNIAEIITKGGQLDFSYGYHRTLSFAELSEKLKTNNGTVYTTLLNMDENKWISNIGAAVFKNWKLIGYLDAFDVRCANWITQSIDMATIVEDYDESGALASYVVSEAQSIIKPVVSNDRLSFQVNIATKGVLSQIAGLEPGSIDSKFLNRLERIMEERIKKEAEWIIAKAQKEHRADYLDFGHSLKNKYPGIYESLDWENVFPDVPVEVRVEARMTGIGSIR